ncbi:MAG: hypothetical protein IPL61_25135 [Myxococcales bacterium]|nr:hypothetical protein [Myxococcales bacterium]
MPTKKSGGVGASRAPRPVKARAGAARTAKVKAEPSPAALDAVTRALDHRDDAAGRAFLQPGFAYTPEQDLLFALGWPHLRWLRDDHPDDVEPTEATLMRISSENGWYGLVWPRGLATRFVRGYARSSVNACNLNPTHALPVLADATPIRAGEGPRLMAQLFGNRRYRGGAPTEHFVFLLEAMHGTEQVLSWALTAFEQATTATEPLDRDEEACTLATTMGLLMLRVPPAAAAAARVRIEALLETAPTEPLREHLRAAIGGAAGAQALGLQPSFYLNVTDDPAAVAAAAKVGKHITSGRLIFLGGADVVRAILPHWRRVESEHETVALARWLAEVQLPEAIELLATLAVGSRARAAATALLATRVAYARPILEQAAKGPSGDTYQKALALLARAGG